MSQEKLVFLSTVYSISHTYTSSLSRTHIYTHTHTRTYTHKNTHTRARLNEVIFFFLTYFYPLILWKELKRSQCPSDIIIAINQNWEREKNLFEKPFWGVLYVLLLHFHRIARVYLHGNRLIPPLHTTIYFANILRRLESNFTFHKRNWVFAFKDLLRHYNRGEQKMARMYAHKDLQKKIFSNNCFCEYEMEKVFSFQDDGVETLWIHREVEKYGAK